MKPNTLARRDDRLGLAALATALLDATTPLAELKRACEAFHATCLDIIPPLDVGATQLASGKALSPADAARCVLDPLRTAYLLRAVEAAISARLAQAPQATVDVLYAGCGPLAPLALSLAHRFRDQGVRFTLVDIHASSLANAQRLFELAGVGDALRDTWCADAATLHLPAGYLPDVLVTEVMQRALAHEPQLAVVANLMSQCSPESVLVPERITVSARLARMTSESPGAIESLDLGTLIDVSKSTLPLLSAALAVDAMALPEQRLRVPRDAASGLTLMLHTRIEAMSGLVLADDDSGLTCPQPQLALGTLAPGESLVCSYRLGRDPGFQVRRLPSSE